MASPFPVKQCLIQNIDIVLCNPGFILNQACHNKSFKRPRIRSYSYHCLESPSVSLACITKMIEYLPPEEGSYLIPFPFKKQSAYTCLGKLKHFVTHLSCFVHGQVSVKKYQLIGTGIQE